MKSPELERFYYEKNYFITSILYPLVACVHDDDEGLTDFQGDGSHATTQVDDEDRIKVQTIQRSELVVEKKEDLTKAKS